MGRVNEENGMGPEISQNPIWKGKVLFGKETKISFLIISLEHSC